MSDTTHYRGSSPAELESTICKIQSVTSAKVILDDDQEIIEIHVLADSGRGAKQVVRDVESALMAEHDIKVDHRKISIARVDGEARAEKGNVRVKIISVQSIREKSRLNVKVSLEHNGQICEGSVSGPISSSNNMRLSSQATISAVENIIDEHCHIVLEDIASCFLSRYKIAVVVLSWVRDGLEETLVGAVPLINSHEEAAVRATLNALNRRVIHVNE